RRDWYDGRTNRAGAEAREDPFRAVRGEHADVRAFDDVGRQQRARHAPHLGLELRVRPRATFEDECRPRPPPGGDVPDEAAEREPDPVRDAHFFPSPGSGAPTRIDVLPSPWVPSHISWWARPSSSKGSTRVMQGSILPARTRSL